MMAAIRRWWQQRRSDLEDTTQARIRRAQHDEQAKAEFREADRRLSENDRRLRRLRSQIDVYRDDLHHPRGR